MTTLREPEKWRIDVCREETARHAEMVEYFRNTGRNKHPDCNRYTNSPCLAAIEHGQDPLEDDCQMCGMKFPTWN